MKGVAVVDMKRIFLILFTCSFLLGACAPQQQSSPSMDEIKQLLSDAIQTEDGKKALRKILAEEEFRELLVIEQPEVKKAIEETLLSEEGEEFWKNAFENHKFSESIAKSMQQQQQELMKKLMEDASFQKQLESFFQQPDMQKNLETILQSSTMKEQYEKAIEDVINSPLLQTKWQELILQAGEKDSESNGKKKSGGSDEQDEGASSEENQSGAG